LFNFPNGVDASVGYTSNPPDAEITFIEYINNIFGVVARFYLPRLVMGGCCYW